MYYTAHVISIDDLLNRQTGTTDILNTIAMHANKPISKRYGDFFILIIGMNRRGFRKFQILCKRRNERVFTYLFPGLLHVK